MRSVFIFVNVFWGMLLIFMYYTPLWFSLTVTKQQADTNGSSIQQTAISDVEKHTKLPKQGDPVRSLFHVKVQSVEFLSNPQEIKRDFISSLFSSLNNLSWNALFFPLRISCCWSAPRIYVTSSWRRAFEALLNWLFCAPLSLPFVNNGLLGM